jgi:formate-nitrite transporter family protein
MVQKIAKTHLAAPVRKTDHVRGPSHSTVTLVGYGDFTNPECAETYRAVKRVQKKMGPTLRYVFRSFPAAPEGGELSQKAAEAAEAAGSQGKFWEMHDRIFENFGSLNEFRLARYASSLGLDVRRFQREMIGHAHARRLRAVVAGGRQSGVRGTPTLFINSVRYRSSFGVATLLASVQAANAS